METWTHGHPYPNHEPVRRRFEMAIQHILCHLLSSKQGIMVQDCMFFAMWEVQEIRTFVLSYGHVIPGFSIQRFLMNIEHITNLFLDNGLKAVTQKQINEFLYYANQASKELFDASAGSNAEYFDQDKFEREHKLGPYSKCSTLET